MDNLKRKRDTHEAGNPGQFAAHNRKHDDSVVLSLGRRHVERVLPVVWYEMGLPTPRHRKQVPLRQESSHTVRVREVASEEAAPALTYVIDSPNLEHPLRQTIIRVGSDLYVDEQRPTDSVFKAAAAVSEGSDTSRYGEDLPGRADVQRWMDAAADGLISVNGQVYRRVNEPVYVVHPPAMGAPARVAVTTQPLRESGRTQVFTADQYEAAIAAAASHGEYEAPPAITVEDGFKPVGREQ